LTRSVTDESQPITTALPFTICGVESFQQEWAFEPILPGRRPGTTPLQVSDSETR